LAGSCILLALLLRSFVDPSLQETKMRTHCHIMSVDDALRGISIGTRRTGLPVERAKRCLEEKTR
jgi:hypothetical protein